MGAGKIEQGRYAAGQGMLLSTISSVVLSLLVLFLQQPLYTIMGFSETVRSLAFNYMTIIAAALIFSFWFTGLEAVFRDGHQRGGACHRFGPVAGSSAMWGPVKTAGLCSLYEERFPNGHRIPDNPPDFKYRQPDCFGGILF